MLIKLPPWAESLKLKMGDVDEGEEISRVATIKYLGIHLDEKLTWETHSMELQMKL